MITFFGLFVGNGRDRSVLNLSCFFSLAPFFFMPHSTYLSTKSGQAEKTRFTENQIQSSHGHYHHIVPFQWIDRGASDLHDPGGQHDLPGRPAAAAHNGFPFHLPAADAEEHPGTGRINILRKKEPVDKKRKTEYIIPWRRKCKPR